MVNKNIILLIAMISIGLSACSIQAIEPIPAILPEVSTTMSADNHSSARYEIIDIVNSALGGKTVPIAQDVFQESSRLLIGSKPIVAPNGVIVHGSNNKPTLVFELVKQGENCLLRRLDTMQTWSLKTTVCVKR